MKHRIALAAPVLVAALAFMALCRTDAAPPSTEPASPELTTRQKNLLLQLSDAEANIQAINKALVRTGYKVGVAYDRIDSNLKGNELMDRKGGGPVRWDAFYGRTAKDYGRNGWGDQRPQQFDYIYRANNDQMSRAGQQIVSLEKNQDALLARRRKHEDDQSRLWAVLAFEQIRDREIDLHPISRFALKPEGADANVLRPLVLFLRTADRVAADGLDALQNDQPATFRATGQRMQAAYAALQQSLADALDASDLAPAHQKQGQALKASCKELSEQCAVIADNYANALDRDQAKQDTSKLEFRGQLQASLSTFAVAVENLDAEVTRTAKDWKIEGAKGTATPDAVAAMVIKVEQPKENPTGHPKDEPPEDPLQRGTVWSGTTSNAGKSLSRKLTVLDRDGETARIRYERVIGTRPLEEVASVRIKEGRFTWHTQGVNAADLGGDNTAKVRSDELEIEWRHGAENGSFILHLEPPVRP